MGLHQSLLEQISSVAEYEIGELVYINIPEGEQGVVFAYIIYDTHIEYLIRTATGPLQIDATCIADHKRIV